jgi:arginase
VLAGNCISCIGTLAGLGDPPPAIIRLDAHGDFNTPESTLSGFLDGMVLATAVGRCWGKLAATIPGFHPTPEAQVVLLSARDFDVDERALLDHSAVSLIPGSMACVPRWSRSWRKSRPTQLVRMFISISMCLILQKARQPFRPHGRPDVGGVAWDHPLGARTRRPGCNCYRRLRPRV